MINAQLLGDKITSNSAEAFSLHDRSCFGEKSNGKIEYSFVEALFLLSHGKVQIYSGKKMLKLDELIKKTRKLDKKIELKLTVFSDMRKRGYILKSALKFGADFRVYNKGIKPSEDHALWLLHILKDTDIIHWHEFAAKNRVAHSTKKKLLIAIVDDESDTSYYEVSWLKP